MQKADLLLNVDAKGAKDGIVEISGWALAVSGAPIRFSVLGCGKKKIPFTLEPKERPDVSIALFGNESRKDAGFRITFPGDPDRTYVLSVTDGQNRVKNRFRPSGFTSDWKYRPKAMLSDLKRYRSDLPGVVKDEGLFGFLKYSLQAMKLPDYAYHCRLKKTEPDTGTLLEAREAALQGGPLFSLIVPAYKTPAKFLNEMIDSVLSQTYGRFELCIADGSYPETEVAETIEKAAAKDQRIRYTVLKENRGIAGNTNEAMKLAAGDYIVLMDHDDLLAPDALYELAKAAKDRPACIYTDEDKITADLFTRYQPAFKPDFDPVFLTSNNYVCHLFAVRKDVAEQAGPFDPETDGSQDHDFILRCTECGKTVHVPKVLYHWRSHPGSTAGSSASKDYTSEAGVKAVEKAYARAGQDAKVFRTSVPGHYATIFGAYRDEPLISVILGGGDEAARKTTEKSIIEASSYRNYEFVSCEAEAKGAYLFFLRAGARVEALSLDGYEAFPKNLMARADRTGTGAVGMKVIDRQSKIRFAGAVLNHRHGVDRVLYLEPEHTDAENARVLDARYTAAVPTDALFIRKDVFINAGGFDPRFRLLKGEDLSLKLFEAGMRSVYEPLVTVRVPDETELKPYFLTVRAETDAFVKKHASILASPDPSGNPNTAVHLNKMTWSV